MLWVMSVFLWWCNPTSEMQASGVMSDGPRHGSTLTGGPLLHIIAKSVWLGLTGEFLLGLQRPSLTRVVEWIDFETLALLFGMVITVLPAGTASRRP